MCWFTEIDQITTACVTKKNVPTIHVSKYWKKLLKLKSLHVAFFLFFCDALCRAYLIWRRKAMYLNMKDFRLFETWMKKKLLVSPERSNFCENCFMSTTHTYQLSFISEYCDENVARFFSKLCKIKFTPYSIYSITGAKSFTSRLRTPSKWTTSMRGVSLWGFECSAN